MYGVYGWKKEGWVSEWMGDSPVKEAAAAEAATPNAGIGIHFEKFSAGPPALRDETTPLSYADSLRLRLLRSVAPPAFVSILAILAKGATIGHSNITLLTQSHSLRLHQDGLPVSAPAPAAYLVHIFARHTHTRIKRPS
ncbi:hypothetical protein PG995_007901 [Apiospora arundinis]